MGSISTKIDLLVAQSSKLLEEAARLSELPPEPEFIDKDGNCIVWFQIWYRDNRFPYTYAAVRIPIQGRWFVTGGFQRGISYTWDELMSLITSGTKWDLWVVDGLSRVGGNV